jgi:predicted  nucleic acid-binding Zn-ribbon protein
MRWPDVHQDFTSLVTAGVLVEAAADLDRARLRCRQAREDLTSIRERLDRVLDDAFSKGSFRPIEDLFREEEAALARHEAAMARLAAARERCAGLRLALASEREQMRRPDPRHGIH